MSSDSSKQKITDTRQECLNFRAGDVLPGSFDDASTIRGILVRSIKYSGKSRAAIADEMSFLLGRKVTDKMLNAFTGERDDRRWPGEFDRAFCKATGDSALLAFRAQLAGFHVITGDQKLLMDLGRQFIIRTQAEEQIAILQRQLNGRVA
jgi:hypothetical protein